MRREKAITTAYERIRPHLDTGDLVLFSGRGLSAAIIQSGQFFSHGRDASRWTHVGMVYRPSGELVLLWESTTLTNLDDLDQGRPTMGVQLVALSDRVDTYNGDIAIRLLTLRRTKPMRDKMDELRHKLKGRPYERSRWEMILSSLGDDDEGEEDLSSIFCSELLAESWQAWGLVPEDVPSNRWCPADFASLTTVGEGSLGPVRYIKRQPKPKGARRRRRRIHR